jgi:hypothetical protein
MTRLLPGLAVLAAALAVTPAPAADNPPPGFKSLFNGKDLAGWKPTAEKKMVWKADNGMIVCEAGGGGWLLTEDEFDNFELRCEFRWTKEGGNSGVALRTPPKGDPAYQGMEIQLIDDENWAKVHKFELKDFQHTGSIYDVVPAKKRANKPVGEWNSFRAVADGRKVRIELNGEVLTDANLDDFKDKFEKHPGLKRDKGHVGFQSYNFRVEFRNVFIKPLAH